MEQIKIILFALASFFGIENGRIAAEKADITIYPENKKIEVVQEKLFSILQSKTDSTLVVEQWNKILDLKRDEEAWSEELNEFPLKNFELFTNNNTIQPHLILHYTEEINLKALGIWYNKEKNEFSINNIPQHNLKTDDGKLVGNYWVFKAKDTIAFSIEPFLQLPKAYEKLKTPLEKLVISEN